MDAFLAVQTRFPVTRMECQRFRVVPLRKFHIRTEQAELTSERTRVPSLRFRFNSEVSRASRRAYEVFSILVVVRVVARRVLLAFF